MNGMKPVSDLTLPHDSIVLPSVESRVRLRMIWGLIMPLSSDNLRVLHKQLTEEIERRAPEESKVNQAVMPVFKATVVSAEKTKAFQEAMRKADGTSIDRLMKDPEVDLNQEMGLAVELPPLNQKRNLVISENNPIPGVKIQRIQEGPATVSPIYYAFYQELVANITTGAKAVYHGIFGKLLDDPRIDLNHRKKTAQNEEDGGYGILHLAILKARRLVETVETILNTKRAQVNLPVEHIQSKHHGYTPLDLVVVKWEASYQARSELQLAVKVYQLLLSRGAEHAKKSVPFGMQQELNQFVKRDDTLRRRRSQSVLQLNGYTTN